MARKLFSKIEEVTVENIKAVAGYHSEMLDKYGDLYLEELKLEAISKQNAEQKSISENEKKELIDASDSTVGQNVMRKVVGNLSSSLKNILTNRMNKGVALPSYYDIVYKLVVLYGGEQKNIEKVKGRKPRTKKEVAEVEEADKKVQEITDKMAYELAFMSISKILGHTIKKEYSFSGIAGSLAATIYEELQLKTFNMSLDKQHQGFLFDTLAKKSNKAMAKQKETKIAKEETDIIDNADLYTKTTTYKLATAYAIMAKHGKSYKSYGQLTNDEKEKYIRLAAEIVSIVVSCANIKVKTKDGQEAPLYLFEYIDIDNGDKRAISGISTTPAFEKYWLTTKIFIASNCHQYRPMVIPPKKWTNLNDGGYYGVNSYSYKLLRGVNGHDEYSKTYLEQLNMLDLSKLYSVVNNIQETPWKINSRVYEVAKWVVEVKTENSSFAGIEPLNIEMSENIKIAQKKYTESAENIFAYASEEDKNNDCSRFRANKVQRCIDNAKKQGVSEAECELMLQTMQSNSKRYRKLAKSWNKANLRIASKRGRATSCLDTATAYKKYDKIYFCWNLDFRGRSYPLETSGCNPQGDDLAKGLLQLADVPACYDETAWEWLIITGANAWNEKDKDGISLDKKSFEERINKIKSMHKEIIDVAKDPYSNLMWADADEPFQFLAFCFEYKDAYEYKCKNNGSIVGHYIYIPSHQDGSFNGCQIFSALGLDSVAGRNVNLIPNDKPIDFYQIVANILKPRVEEDAINGSENYKDTTKDGKTILKLGTKTMAKIWLEYGITRKLVKKEVMTFSYGSCQYGFQQKIQKDVIAEEMSEAIINDGIEETIFTEYDTTETYIDNEGDEISPKKHSGELASYLAKHIWDIIVEELPVAANYMKIFKQWSNSVVNSGNCVQWTTPMGLRVQQGYVKYETNVIDIWLSSVGQSLRVYTSEPSAEIDKYHQASSISPNYIHSLDASCLQLTVYNCANNGIKHFSLIHDSYGTSMADTNKLSKILRESFVEMFTKYDVVGKFKEEMQALSKEELTPLPPKGNLDINLVLKSKYMFC